MRDGWRASRAALGRHMCTVVALARCVRLLSRHKRSQWGIESQRLLQSLAKEARSGVVV